MSDGGVRYVAVVGPSECDDEVRADAYAVGAGLAARGAVVVCGGGTGVMAAAAAGVRSASGTVVGLLPGNDRASASPDLTLSLPTGLGQGRNVLVVRAAHVVVAVGGSWGTLSEIALAVRMGIPVVGLRTWSVVGPEGSPVDALPELPELSGLSEDPGHTVAVETARDAAEAVARAVELAGMRAGMPGRGGPLHH